MKKFSSAVEKKKQELKESQVVNERNMYLEFSKKYHKKHGFQDLSIKNSKEIKKLRKNTWKAYLKLGVIIKKRRV